MSRHLLRERTLLIHEVWVGWDPSSNRFFIQVFDSNATAYNEYVERMIEKYGLVWEESLVKSWASRKVNERIVASLSSVSIPYILSVADTWAYIPSLLRKYLAQEQDNYMPQDLQDPSYFAYSWRDVGLENGRPEVLSTMPMFV